LVLQTQKVEEGAFVRAIRQKDASRENLVLVKKKPSVDTYVSILQAIDEGASNPSLIVLRSHVSWITVMQCLRTLEAKGLVEKKFDSGAERTISCLTASGKKLLHEN
jgi:predicted transcriptional regulator